MPKVYEVDFIDETHFYSLAELCQEMQLDRDFVTACVDYGIVETHEDSAGQQCFSLQMLVRLQKAYRLQRDLGINLTGLSVILDLLDDIQELDARLNVLNLRLKHWEQFDEN